jgi:hypothetical protein
VTNAVTTSKFNRPANNSRGVRRIGDSVARYVRRRDRAEHNDDDRKQGIPFDSGKGR